MTELVAPFVPVHGSWTFLPDVNCLLDPSAVTVAVLNVAPAQVADVVIFLCFRADFVAANATVDIAVPTQPDPVPVTSVFGWIIIHQRLGYTSDWNLPWSDYKAGFGSIDADFWLGLERVHLLTSSQPYRLRAEMEGRSTGLWYSAEYWSFEIGDELNDNYRLHVSGYSGDAGDSLQYEGEQRCKTYSMFFFKFLPRLR